MVSLPPFHSKIFRRLKRLPEFAFGNKFMSPQLYYKRTNTNENILNYCELLTEEPYVPPIIAKNAHINTLMSVAKPRPSLSFRIHRETGTTDGGEILLYYDDMVESKDDTSSPLLLIIPGLSGGIHSKYVRHLFKMCRNNKNNIEACMFNYRGTNSNLKTTHVTTAIDTTDLKHVVDALRRKHPKRTIVAVGFSYGANLLTKYAGLYTSDVGLDGLISIGNAFNYLQLAHSLNDEEPNRTLYSKTLTYFLKKRVLTPHNMRLLCEKEETLNSNDIRNARTLWELDNVFTRKLYNFHTVEEYYDQCSSKYYLKSVCVPSLFLNAIDDPFKCELPYHICESENDHLILATTEYGGHIAFERRGKPSYMLSVALEYTNAIDKTN